MGLTMELRGMADGENGGGRERHADGGEGGRVRVRVSRSGFLITLFVYLSVGGWGMGDWVKVLGYAPFSDS